LGHPVTPAVTPAGKSVAERVQHAPEGEISGLCRLPGSILRDQFVR